MRAAVADYKSRVAAAWKRCDAAFDKAARAYRDKKDFASVKDVVEEKSKLLGVLVPGKFAMTCDPPVDGWTIEFAPNGTFVSTDGTTTLKGTWSQRAREVEAAYEKKSSGIAYLVVKDADTLTGENTHTNGKSWKWTLKRIK